MHKKSARLLSNFKDLKSIIVLTVPYANSATLKNSLFNADNKERGRIAKYAFGRDYHRSIRKRLKKLEAAVGRLLDAKMEMSYCVDTSPLHEKTLAELAGLGFIGKNTCLIQPRGGSYCFLAAVLTNLELVYDSPVPWNCGSCTLCLEACPTGALVEPYQLDARRCISYLTIEYKGSIKSEMRPFMGNWILGCDICQEVCPYNRKITKAPLWEEFQDRSEINLAEILSVRTEEAFLEKFAGTSFMRAKRESVLRNAAIAAGNQHCAHLVPVLAQTLQEDSSPVVRSSAAWALGKIRTETSFRELQLSLNSEIDPLVQKEIREALQATSSVLN